MKGLLQDLRFGARLLWRSPGFAAASIVALALGIGASTAVFTVLDGVVLRPLPYPNPEQLVTLWDANPGSALAHEPLSPVTFLDDRALTRVFDDAAGWWRPNLNLTDSGRDPAFGPHFVLPGPHRCWSAYWMMSHTRIRSTSDSTDALS